MVMAAVESNGLALQYASPVLRRDPAVVRTAVAQNATAMYYADESVKRARQRWATLRLNWKVRNALIWWLATSAHDEAHFDDDGKAVLTGSGARAAKRDYDTMAGA